MVYDIEASLSDEEQRRKIKDIDLYLTKQHVVITTVPTLATNFYQPYLMGGYVGQAQLMGVELARFWIDQDMKESMGR